MKTIISEKISDNIKITEYSDGSMTFEPIEVKKVSFF